MYARKVDGRTLTLAVSGMLWRRSLVMVDVETKSLWSHLLGKAMRGPFQGRKLEVIPAQMTDWKTWRSRHPNTTVVKLSRTSQGYRRQFYRDPSMFVLGIAAGNRAKAWPMDQLLVQPVVNDEFDGKPVLVCFDAESKTGTLYHRKVAGQEFTFDLKGTQVVDRETGSQWDLLTGRSTSGSLAGNQLQLLPAILSYRKAWTIFHPESQIWQVP